MDAPPRGYGGDHRAVVGGQVGTPPVASHVCCASFHDPLVAEGIFFTVLVGVLFWGASQFEPLIVTIIFPLAHVSSYTGPWAVKGTDLGEHFQRALQEGFKRPVAGSSPNGSRVAESGSGGPKAPPETLRGFT